MAIQYFVITIEFINFIQTFCQKKDNKITADSIQQMLPICIGVKNNVKIARIIGNRGVL